MNCPNCGASCAEGMEFCSACGTPLAEQTAPVEAPVAAAVAEPIPAPMAEPAAEPADAPAEAPVATAVESPVAEAPAAEKKSGFSIGAVFAKVKPFLKNKLVLAGIAATVLLLIVLCVVFIATGNNNGFIQLKQSVLLIENDDEVGILVNNKLLKKTIPADGYSDIQQSLDGKITAFMVYEKDEDSYGVEYDLYIVKGNKFKKVAQDVMSFELSASGKGLAYTTVEDEEEGTYGLYLMKVGSKKATKVSTELCNTDFAISPDGKSVAYYEAGDEGEPDELYFAKGKKSQKVTSKETLLLGLSDNGKYIYAACGEEDSSEANLYKFNKKGDRVKLGKISSEEIYFNADHTQIMFFNDGKTYVSTKGKDAVKASSGELTMVDIPNSGAMYADGSTYPVDNLFDHVYTSNNDGSRSAWIIKKNPDKNVKLASKVSSCTLDESGKYMYYLRNGEELRVLKLSHGQNAADKSKELADEVDNYVITSNRKLAYYISDDTLYSVNGKKGGRSKTIKSDELGLDMVLNSKDVLFFTVEGEIYACSNGKTAKMVLEDSELLLSTSNGIVFAGSEESLYANKTGKKFKLLMKIDIDD